MLNKTVKACIWITTNSISSFHSPGTRCSLNSLLSRHHLSWMADVWILTSHIPFPLLIRLWWHYFSIDGVLFQGTDPFQIFQQHIFQLFSVKRKQAIVYLNSCQFLWITNFLKLGYQGFKFFLMSLFNFLSNVYPWIFFFIISPPLVLHLLPPLVRHLLCPLIHHLLHPLIHHVHLLPLSVHHH